MTRRTTLFAALAVLALVGSAAAAMPVAAQPSDQAGADQADGVDRGPGEGQEPPDFLGDLLGDDVPDFVGDLLGSLPVPEFVTNLF